MQTKDKLEKFKLDEYDKLILNELQLGLPLCENPFEIIAHKLNMDEDYLIEKLNNLKKEGLIRRFGGIFDSNKVGIKSSLMALKVDKKIDDKEFAHIIDILNSYPQITHNYIRDHEYQIWFTLMAKDDKDFIRLIKEIKRRTLCDKLLKLEAIKKHKTKVYLKL
ncbi:MAG: Lrp/AsnC family transcriptional regulator [Peptostreptococcaceae bacterium]|jgi:DNA-binding Lrp family transcriptional regulator|nr:Lrp/AsnC family transcriptional regulator [Peptostreptococcaceae bacterium]